MYIGNKKALLFISVLLMFLMIGCEKYKGPPIETGVPDGEPILVNEPMPVETTEIENASDEDAGLKEYTGWVGA